MKSAHFSTSSPMKNTPNSALQRSISSSNVQNSKPPPPNMMAKAPVQSLVNTSNVTNGAMNAPSRPRPPQNIPPLQLGVPGQSPQASRQSNPQQTNLPPNRSAQVQPSQQLPPAPANRSLPQQAEKPHLAPHQFTGANRNASIGQGNQTSSGSTSTSDVPPQPIEMPIPANVPIGFFSAREAEVIQAPPAVLPPTVSFNPHAESPSIRKTAGFDHSKSKPVGSKDLNNGQAPTGPNLIAKSSFVNPAVDQARRIGMPPNATSPIGNRGSYKPPTLKRPLDGANPQQ